jgi:hypothetical protein
LSEERRRRVYEIGALKSILWPRRGDRGVEKTT